MFKVYIHGHWTGVFPQLSEEKKSKNKVFSNSVIEILCVCIMHALKSSLYPCYCKVSFE